MRGRISSENSGIRAESPASFPARAVPARRSSHNSPEDSSRGEARDSLSRAFPQNTTTRWLTSYSKMYSRQCWMLEKGLRGQKNGKRSMPPSLESQCLAPPCFGKSAFKSRKSVRLPVRRCSGPKALARTANATPARYQNTKLGGKLGALKSSVRSRHRRLNFGEGRCETAGQPGMNFRS